MSGVSVKGHAACGPAYDILSRWRFTAVSEPSAEGCPTHRMTPLQCSAAIFRTWGELWVWLLQGEILQPRQTRDSVIFNIFVWLKEPRENAGEHSSPRVWRS